MLWCVPMLWSVPMLCTIVWLHSGMRGRLPQTSQQSSQARPQQNIAKPEQAAAKLQQSTNGTTSATPQTVCVYDRSGLRRSVHHHAGGAHSSSLKMAATQKRSATTQCLCLSQILAVHDFSIKTPTSHTVKLTEVNRLIIQVEGGCYLKTLPSSQKQARSASLEVAWESLKQVWFGGKGSTHFMKHLGFKIVDQCDWNSRRTCSVNSLITHMLQFDLMKRFCQEF